MSNGYIKLHRKMLEWEWYDDANTMRVFLHLLLKAAHKPIKWRGIDIPAGGLITSYAKLAKELHMTVQSIRTAINKLKSTGEITSQATSHYTIVVVQKWSNYQDTPTSQSASSATNEQQTSNKQATTYKNDKNEENDKNIYYPRARAREGQNDDDSKTAFLEVLLPDTEIQNPTETANVFRAYMKASPTRLTEATAEHLQTLVEEYGEEKVITAIDKAVRQNSVRLSYIEAVLRNKGSMTAEERKRAEREAMHERMRELDRLDALREEQMQ